MPLSFAVQLPVQLFKTEALVLIDDHLGSIRNVERESCQPANVRKDLEEVGKVDEPVLSIGDAAEAERANVLGVGDSTKRIRYFEVSSNRRDVWDELQDLSDDLVAQ